MFKLINLISLIILLTRISIKAKDCINECGTSEFKGKEKFYVAGAISYSPNYKFNTSKENIAGNLKDYLQLIDEAQWKEVDILVFPEATFNYYEKGGREELLDSALEIPDPIEKIPQWQNPEGSEILKLLSAKVNEVGIYVLVNLVEKVECTTSNDVCKHPKKQHHDGYDLYNTNIVFDRDGRIISRYRKFNLFLEPNIDQPLTPELATFDTDFNVKFGHFICFDITFKSPAMDLVRDKNITNFLYPTFWFSELPFLTAEQVHQGWAYGNNVNLIVSGGNVPKIGTSGSGIYIGRHRIATITMTPLAPVKRLMTALVPKDISDDTTNEIERRTTFSPTEMESLTVTEIWSTLGVTTYNIAEKSQQICAEEHLCCSFDIDLTKKEIPDNKISYHYKLVANYTTRLYSSDRKVNEFYCSIVACTDENSESCGKRFAHNENLLNSIEFNSIKIRAQLQISNFSDILVIPNTLDTTILPLDIEDYTFDESKEYKDEGVKQKDFISSKRKLKNLLSFGVFGRNFNEDTIIETNNVKISSITADNEN